MNCGAAGAPSESTFVASVAPTPPLPAVPPRRSSRWRVALIVLAMLVVLSLAVRAWPLTAALLAGLAAYCFARPNESSGLLERMHWHRIPWLGGLRGRQAASALVLSAAAVIALGLGSADAGNVPTDALRVAMPVSQAPTAVPTNVAAARTQAPTATPRPTATPTPQPTPPPDKGVAQYLDPRELVADPRSFIGRNIYLQGKSLTVEQRPAQSGGLFSTARPAYTWVQLLAQSRGKSTFQNESIVVEVVPADRSLLKDECYRIYGLVAGVQKVRLILTGAERDVPVVTGYAFEKARAGDYDIGCANP